MSRHPRRVQLALGYILLHQPYRDTSRILEVFTREHGRLTLFARGVRGPKARLAAVLQPFQPLWLSWAGRSEAAQLTAAERAFPETLLPPAALLACFYLNELLIKLTTRDDPHPQLYDAYHRTLQRFAAAEGLERPLRLFEKRLLEEVGYGLDTAPAQGIESSAYYCYRPGEGLARAAASSPGAVPGSSVASLAAERLASAPELEDARTLLAAALAQALEGRELSTRVVARSIARRGARS